MILVDLSVTHSQYIVLWHINYVALMQHWLYRHIIWDFEKKMNFENFGDKLSKDDLPMSKVKIGLVFSEISEKQSWQVYLSFLPF